MPLPLSAKDMWKPELALEGRHCSTSKRIASLIATTPEAKHLALTLIVFFSCFAFHARNFTKIARSQHRAQSVVVCYGKTGRSHSCLSGRNNKKRVIGTRVKRNMVKGLNDVGFRRINQTMLAAKLELFGCARGDVEKSLSVGRDLSLPIDSQRLVETFTRSQAHRI